MPKANCKILQQAGTIAAASPVTAFVVFAPLSRVRLILSQSLTGSALFEML